MRLAATAALLLLVAACPTPGRADDWADQPDPAFKPSAALCRAARAVALPPAPATLPAAGCDAQASLYGIGRAVDPAAARLCAQRELKDGEPSALAGAGILATIYANGSGVPRSYPIALRYACLIDGAPAEMDGRIKRLAALRDKGGDKGGDGTPFDVCTDTTSGNLGGACAERDGLLADARRARDIAALTAGLDPAARAAFARLAAAETRFAKSSDDNEVDMTGTARGSLIVANGQAHAEGYLATLRAVLDGAVRPDGEAAEKAADKALNAAYGKVMATKDGLGTVERSGIKATQRLWLSYRDAFLAFAKVAAPGVRPAALAARLSVQRTKDLAGFL